jgi:hypothetical protein
MPRFQRGLMSIHIRRHAKNDITTEKARSFATCDRRASPPKVRVMLTGTAALGSYLDPENQ